MARFIRVAVVQPLLQWRQAALNLAAVRALVDEACRGGEVDLVVLPEHFSATTAKGGPPQPLDEVRQFVAEAARANQVNLVGGSAEVVDDDGRLRNICFIADRAGGIVGRYDKRRLFGGESGRGVVPGERDCVFELDCGRIGVLICNDLWCPQLSRQAAARVDLLCVPAETSVRDLGSAPYARVLWWSLAMTRAHENAAPMAVADVAEVAYPLHSDAGASSINDPSRKPDVAGIQLTLASGRPGILAATIDLDACAAYRDYRRQSGLLDR